jgi:hypothetical protein
VAAQAEVIAAPETGGEEPVIRSHPVIAVLVGVFLITYLVKDPAGFGHLADQLVGLAAHLADSLMTMLDHL